MIKTRIAKRYARALFEIAREAGRIEDYGRDLGVVTAVFKADSAIREGLTSVALTHTVKAAFLDTVIEVSAVDVVVGNFLKVVLDARKMPVLAEITDEYIALADEATGKVKGEVVSPTPLTEAEIERLSAALGAALGKKVVLNAREDATLIGGVVARVGNLVFDASVRTQIQRMKESLLKG